MEWIRSSSTRWEVKYTRHAEHGNSSETIPHVLRTFIDKPHPHTGPHSPPAPELRQSLLLCSDEDADKLIPTVQVLFIPVIILFSAWFQQWLKRLEYCSEAGN